MMSTTYEQQELQLSFTFKIVEMVKVIASMVVGFGIVALAEDYRVLFSPMKVAEFARIRASQKTHQNPPQLQKHYKNRSSRRQLQRLVR